MFLIQASRLASSCRKSLDEVQQLFVVGNELLLGDPLHKVADVVPCRVVQGGHAVDELRHDHHDQRVDQQQTEQDGQSNGQHVGKAVHPFREQLVEKCFNQLHTGLSR